MSYTLDAMGKACPMPVIMAKKALEAGQTPLTVLVDNPAAVENLKRLGTSSGLPVSSAATEGGFAVLFGEGEIAAPAAAAQAAPACTAAGCGTAVFIGKDHVGEGEGELGGNLMKMFLYTLSQADWVPASVLFMNSGVRLPAGEEQQVIDSIRALLDKGAEVLVCGTCLSFYGLTEQVKVGTVSNMYDIVERMAGAAKVITV